MTRSRRAVAHDGERKRFSPQKTQRGYSRNQVEDKAGLEEVLPQRTPRSPRGSCQGKECLFLAASSLWPLCLCGENPEGPKSEDSLLFLCDLCALCGETSERRELAYRMTQAMHPDIEQLVAYFTGGLGDQEEETIELHVAQCVVCARLSGRCFAATDVLDAWSAAAHGVAVQRRLLTEALQRAEGEEKDPALRHRLRRWREQWAGHAQAALQAVIDASGVVARGIDGLTRRGSDWSFGLETAVAGTWGEAADDGSEAILVSSKLSTDQPRALIEIRGASGDIVVRIDNLRLGSIPPLVVLITLKAGDAAVTRVAEVRAQPGAQTGIARFTQVEAGSYIVAFEPLES